MNALTFSRFYCSSPSMHACTRLHFSLNSCLHPPTFLPPQHISAPTYISPSSTHICTHLYFSLINSHSPTFLHHHPTSTLTHNPPINSSTHQLMSALTCNSPSPTHVRTHPHFSLTKSCPHPPKITPSTCVCIHLRSSLHTCQHVQCTLLPHHTPSLIYRPQHINAGCLMTLYVIQAQPVFVV